MVSGYIPKRSFRSPEEFQIYFQKHKTLIVEATEQRTQHPKARDYQELIRTDGAVDHSIGGMKRYRILSDRLRIHDCGMYNKVVEVCAGLWNFNLTN